jgi:hypothetical protein
MSRGPVLSPVHCSTIELKDLGDIIDFDKEGNEGTTYGLQLNGKGFYVRKEIEAKFPKLKQISDLDVPSKLSDGSIYTLKREGGKWTIHPLVSEVKMPWLIQFEFYSPHTFMGEESTFRKCLNEKPQIVSLVPVIPDTIKLKPYLQDRYSLAGEGYLKFIPTVALGNSWSVVIEFVCEKNTLSNLNSTEILNNMRISWSGFGEDKRVRLLIQKNNAKIETSCTLESININAPDTIETLEVIRVKYIYLTGFYYTPKLLTQEQLDRLDDDL